MTDRFRLFGVLLGALVLSGCGSTPELERTEVKDPGIVPFELSAHFDISLEGLLAKSRKELADLGEEWTKKVEFQRQQYRKGEVRSDFLPAARLHLALPVWRQSHFDAALGLSVPPYYSGGRDADLALHLARHGDADGALKLVDPGDTRSRAQIESLRLNRNFPVEWTRLVALMLHEGEFRLTNHDQHGARQFIVLHKQLQGVLDAKARTSALGAALWSRGRGVLIQAEEEWRKTKETALSDQAKNLLDSWGAGSWSNSPLGPGIARAEAERILQATARDKVLVAPLKLRALDLLALPFPEQGLEGVTSVFDPAGGLREVLLSYQAKLPERVPYPAQLASRLDENDALAAANLPETGQVRGRIYSRGGTQIRVETIPENPVVGALVRVSLSGPPAPPVPLPRSLGEVSLDRSFEHNRRLVALNQWKTTIDVRQPANLKRVDQPLKQVEVRLDKASLQRESKLDLLKSVTLSYSYPKAALPLHFLAEPLWATAGVADIHDVRDDTGGHLALTWDDSRTRYVLRLPHRRSRPPELAVNDLTTDGELVKRMDKVRQADLAERRERFAQKNKFAPLPRDLERIRIGMTESQFLGALPREKDALRRKIDGGWAVSYLKLPKKRPYVARELTARFDPSGRLAELRVFYSNTPDTKGIEDLLDEWKKRGGAPEVIRPGPATPAWADLPAAAPTVLYRWQDDATLASLQVDDFGAVAVLHNCPLDHSDGLPLPRLSSLPRGPGGIQLGMTRDQVLKKWSGPAPKEVDGYLVCSPRDRSEFDVILVRFEKERAVRILARHVLDSKSQSAQMGELLRKAWGRSFHSLGWQTREIVTGEQNLPGWATCDDQTRCRIFWEQDAGDNLRLLTEWKEWQ
jgi:hypothetical protein